MGQNSRRTSLLNPSYLLFLTVGQPVSPSALAETERLTVLGDHSRGKRQEIYFEIAFVKLTSN